jgi:hypothetical protein
MDLQGSGRHLTAGASNWLVRSSRSRKNIKTSAPSHVPAIMLLLSGFVLVDQKTDPEGSSLSKYPLVSRITTMMGLVNRYADTGMQYLRNPRY